MLRIPFPDAAAGPVTLFSDNFNRANFSMIGPGWTSVFSNINGAVQIVNNSLYFGNPNVGYSEAAAVPTGVNFSVNHFSQIEVLNLNELDNSTPLMVDFVNSNSFSWIDYGAESASYKEKIGGVVSTAGFVGGLASFSAGDVIRAEALGATVTLVKNGTIVGVFTRNSLFQSATQTGIYAQVPVSYDTYYDNYTSGNL